MIHITGQDVSYNRYFCPFFIVHEVVCPDLNSSLDVCINTRGRDGSPTNLEYHSLSDV